MPGQKNTKFSKMNELVWMSGCTVHNTFCSLTLRGHCRSAWQLLSFQLLKLFQPQQSKTQASRAKLHVLYFRLHNIIISSTLTLILRRSRTGTVWFYTSTSNKRAARQKLYTKSLTRDLKFMYSRLTLVRISINL